MKKTIQNNEELEAINAEIFSHMANPRNYGEMKDAHGVGKSLNEKTQEFLMVFIKVNDENILESISYGCNANQDSSLSASLFTEMVKGDTLDNTIESLMLMEQKVLDVPFSQKLNSSMVLHAFRAALINRENRIKGMEEEIFTIPLNLEEN
ncbi:MAG: iron-sulfur cluster assembly scaffold protein [Arcobacteraceae bacterium]